MYDTIAGLPVHPLVITAVATQSGEALQERLGNPPYGHVEKGELAAISCYVLFGVAVVTIFLLSHSGSTGLFNAVGVLVSLVATGFLVFAVVDAGHSGASAAWKEQVASSTPTGGD